MKIDVVECQHDAVLKALEMALVLEENLPGVEKVYVEPNNALFANFDEEKHTDMLPAIVINIGQEDVLTAVPTSNVQEFDRNELGELTNMKQCCTTAYRVRQFYSMDVVVSECDTSHLIAGKISCMLEQVMCRQPMFTYGGNFNRRTDENVSSEFYIRSYVYYFEYDKNY